MTRGPSLGRRAGGPCPGGACPTPTPTPPPPTFPPRAPHACPACAQRRQPSVTTATLGGGPTGGTCPPTPTATPPTPTPPASHACPPVRSEAAAKRDDGDAPAVKAGGRLHEVGMRGWVVSAIKGAALGAPWRVWVPQCSSLESPPPSPPLSAHDRGECAPLWRSWVGPAVDCSPHGISSTWGLLFGLSLKPARHVKPAPI